MWRFLFSDAKCVLRILIIIMLIFLTESLAIEAPKQKIVKVSSMDEFQKAVGDFVTIQLLKDIVIPFKNSSYTDGIMVQDVYSLIIEGNGFKLDGESENIPYNVIGPNAITISGSYVTINGLTVTNFGCNGGAISVMEGTNGSITNSFL